MEHQTLCSVTSSKDTPPALESWVVTDSQILSTRPGSYRNQIRTRHIAFSVIMILSGIETWQDLTVHPLSVHMFCDFYQETSGCYDLQSAVLRIPARTILFLGCLPMRILILEHHSNFTHGPFSPIETWSSPSIPISQWSRYTYTWAWDWIVSYHVEDHYLWYLISNYFIALKPWWRCVILGRISAVQSRRTIPFDVQDSVWSARSASLT